MLFSAAAAKSKKSNRRSLVAPAASASCFRNFLRHDLVIQVIDLPAKRIKRRVSGI
jgi:hypothetical protein